MEKKEVQHQVHLDAAVKLLTGDFAEEANRAGLDNQFQRWIEDLKDVNNPEFHQIIVDLQALKAHFGSGTLDQNLIAQLLTRLGTNTGKVAVFSEGNTRSRVEKLSDALLSAASQVQGGPATTDGNLPQDKSSHN